MTTLIDMIGEDKAVAQDTPEPITTNDAASDPKEVTETLEGILQAMDQYEALGKVHDIISKSGGTDTVSMEMARIVIDNVKKNTGIFGNNGLMAMEAHSVLTMEGFLSGITDMMKAIWDTIVRTFQAIWDSFKRLFGMGKEQIKISQAEKAVAELDKVKKEAKTLPIVEVSEVKEHKRQPFDNQLMKFGYLGKTITLKMLLQELYDLKSSIQKCTQLLSSLEVANVNMFAFIDNTNKHGFDDQSFTYATLGFKTYFESIERTFDKGEDLYKYKDYLMEKTSIAYNDVDRKSIRSLKGITRGSKLFAFQTSTEDFDSARYRFLITPEDVTTVAPAMDLIEFDQIHLYATEIESLLRVEFSTMVTEFQKRSERIEKTQKDMLRSMDRMVHDSRDNASMNERMVFYRAIVKALAGTFMGFNSVEAVIDRSLFDHSSFLQAAYPLVRDAIQE